MVIEIRLSGFLYLLILVLQIAMAAFGYILDPRPKHYDSDAKLLEINDNPKKFQKSIVLALIEHFSVITLAIMLFIAFSSYNLILGIVLTIFRTAEGSIQVYIEKDYWKLLNIARKYSATSGTEKKSLSDSFRNILQTKSFRFGFVMICWSIGTLAFSILLVTYEVVPVFIGWLGIVASIPVGFVNVIKIIKPNFKFYDGMSSVGGLLAIGFEVIIGGWLLFF
ncbi:MAG: DUF4386 domain-containing protein [Promethearchaeota archaeon]